jgi:6-phosphogluconolactonase
VNSRLLIQKHQAPRSHFPDLMNNSTSPDPNSTYLVYIGTYTDLVGPLGRKSEGIYLYRMDAETGALALDSVASGIRRPSFLALHPNGRFLYAVSEVGDRSGGLTAFALDPVSGRLRALNQQPSHGAASCHLSVDSTGRFLFAASYSSGNIVVLPINADGSLRPAIQVVEHVGPGETPENHDTARAHMILQDPSARYVLVPDLGLDQLMVYRFDADSGALTPNDPPHVKAVKGAGPRHLDFHPSGQYAYLINELNGTLSAYAYDAARGRFDHLHTLSTLPEGYTGPISCADVHVAPSGRFVYGSNRGHDSLAAFAIDPATGRLTPAGHTPTGGKTPRNFALDPRGRFLIAANQDSDSLVVFRVDAETGALTPTGQVVDVPAPVCVKFHVLPAAR